ncbi:MAG: repressor LexA [Verrucomicrobia bacterium]|jgi:repressor LexA|nr:MAG: repressor LexA [Verrucomicrobiota bacterium]
MNLTERQQELYNFLRDYSRETGIMPSTREIQKHFGFLSQTAAVSHLRALERKGVIQRLAGKARAVIFPEELGMRLSDLLTIPVFGNIPAGRPEEAASLKEGTVTVDPSNLGLSTSAKTFALKVRGDSMIDAHIVDGDLVILESREPRNKDIVAALIDGETTLKRYVEENRRTFLRAENPRYPDLIPAAELIIQGVMVGLMRTGRKA